MLSGGNSAHTLFLGTDLGVIALYVGIGLYILGAYLLVTASGVRG
jgi:hypothetical protein